MAVVDSTTVLWETDKWEQMDKTATFMISLSLCMGLLEQHGAYPLKTSTTGQPPKQAPLNTMQHNQTGLSSSHNIMQAPCRAQLAGHTSNKFWPAQMRETWEEILAAGFIVG